MAVKDTARVRARLTGLYPKASGLKKERLDALAAKLTATDDSTDEDIDAELTSINDSGFYTFEQIKTEDDRVTTELAKAKKPQHEAPKPTTEDPKPEGDLSPLEKRLKEMEEKLAAKEAQEAQNNLAARFKADERLKGVPASWIKNNTPKTEEEFEDAVTALSEDFKQFATENKLSTFGGDTPPAGAKPKGGEKEQVSMDDAKALAGQLLGNNK